MQELIDAIHRYRLHPVLAALVQKPGPFSTTAMHRLMLWQLTQAHVYGRSRVVDAGSWDSLAAELGIEPESLTDAVSVQMRAVIRTADADYGGLVCFAAHSDGRLFFTLSDLLMRPVPAHGEGN